ncbi:SAM-dependent methyltransferase [Streptomyces sp. Isolate_219]|uniref:SAM-dependent methyltransferase n=1 Tax=Streptomyces sp. Isolate_219 TaxID=2950110 RepID=UPI0021C613B4|nr:SAM-dependent methyltransferase [Streptomyces sp. Isolate_219]MCR8573052.1 SAM-dependent methyltransferase [Streptomyces sp. Isolate_219]
MPDDEMSLPRPATTAADQLTAPSWTKKSPPKSKAAVRAPAKFKARKYLAPRDPHEHARKIAEKVMDAWYQNFGGSSIDIPLGTVAALALLRNLPGLADRILHLQPHELPQFFKEIYLGHWIKRPDLINRAIPLHDWAWNPEPDKQQLRAVHAVTHAAINTGLMDLTGHKDPDRRSESDVLSPLLTGMRHKSDKKWRGEYHTPPCVTDLMARILVDKDIGGENKSIREPAVGSGTMLRSAAQRLRELQLNPHDYTWYGNDVDPLSAACAAVNTIIWDLGPQALIGCANSLAPEDDYAKTVAEARDAFKQRDDYMSTATTIVGYRRAFRLLDELTKEPTAA